MLNWVAFTSTSSLPNMEGSLGTAWVVSQVPWTPQRACGQPADGSNTQNASSSPQGPCPALPRPLHLFRFLFLHIREVVTFVRRRRVCDTNYSPFNKLESFQSCRSLKRLQVLSNRNPAVLTRKGSLKISASEKEREEHRPLSANIFLGKYGYHGDTFTNEGIFKMGGEGESWARERENFSLLQVEAILHQSHFPTSRHLQGLH